MSATPITFIGDVHGKVDEYVALAIQHVCTLQLGDFGIGFKGIEAPDLGEEHRAFYGNHDNPTLAKTKPLFLPNDYGVWREVFYVAGGYSIDKHLRVEGVSWWPDEEISIRELQKAIDLYAELKPRYVASHECPVVVFERVIQPIIRGRLIRNRTTAALQAMFDIHKPECWFFAHHHLSIQTVIDGCRFRGLAELEIETEHVQTSSGDE